MDSPASLLNNNTQQFVQYWPAATTSSGKKVFVIGGGDDIGNSIESIVIVSPSPDINFNQQRETRHRWKRLWLWMSIILILLTAAIGSAFLLLWLTEGGDIKPGEFYYGKNKNNYCNKNTQQQQQHGGAVTGHKLCTQIAIDIMREQHGSAVDAAIAAGFCLEAVHPHSTGISGGGFMLIFDPNLPEENKATAFDFRETAPASAAAAGGVAVGADAVAARNIGVPGMLRGFAAAHRAYGKLPWAQLLSPTIKILREGFAVSKRLAHSTTNYGENRYMNAELRNFLQEIQQANESTLIMRPQLATMYERLSRYGAEDFYTGKLAQVFVEEVALHGGNITLEDLRNYKVVQRQPLRMQLSDRKINGSNSIELLTMPAPSSGSVLIFVMKMLQKFEVATHGNATEAEEMHFVAEVLKLAFLQRTRLGDPDAAATVDAVNSAELDIMSDANVEKLYSAINLTHTLPGGVESYYRAANIPYPSENSTKKIDGGTAGSVFIDSDGLIVSAVHTINSAFGCGIMSEKLGMVFNDELDDFGTATTIEGKSESDEKQATEYAANQLESGKRPLSSMVPVIFYSKPSPHHHPDPDNSAEQLLQCGLRGATAGEGGARILSSTAQILWRFLLKQPTDGDDGESSPLAEAVKASRVFVYRPQEQVQYDRPTVAHATVEELRNSFGQNFKFKESYWMSTVNAIVQVNDNVTAVGDSRRYAAEFVYK